MKYHIDYNNTAQSRLCNNMFVMIHVPHDNKIVTCCPSGSCSVQVEAAISVNQQQFVFHKSLSLTVNVFITVQFPKIFYVVMHIVCIMYSETFA